MHRAISHLLLISMIPYVASGQAILWEPVPGPASGEVVAFLADDDGSLYARYAAHGWNGPSMLLKLQADSMWKMLDLEPRVLALAADGDGRVYAGTQRGVLMSLDSGETWVEVGFPGQSVSVIALMGDSLLIVGVPEHPGTRLFAADTETFQWAALFELEPCPITKVLPLDDGMLLIGSGASPMGGTCGVLQVNVRTGAEEGSRTPAGWVTDISASGETVFVASEPTELASGGLLRRVGPTGDWEVLIPDGHIGAVIESNGRVLAGHSGGLSYTDDGINWRLSTLDGHPVTSLVRSPNGTLYAGSTEVCVVAVDWVPGACSPGGGLHYSTDDGDSWHAVMQPGPFETPVKRLSLDGSGRLFSLDDLSLAVSPDIGATWHREGLRDFHDVLSGVPVYEGAIDLAATADSRFLLMEDGGFSRFEDSYWHPMNIFVHPRALYAHPDGALLVAAGDADGTSGGIFRSAAGDGTDLELVFDAGVMSVARGPGGRIVGAGPRMVLVSEDGGAEWEKFEIPTFSGLVAAAAADADGRLYAAASDGRIFVSDAGRSEWTMSESGLGNVIGLVVPDPKRIILISETDGAVLSEDGGTSWTPLDDGWPVGRVNHALLHPSGFLFVAHEGGIVRSAEPVGVSSETDVPARPAGLVLHPNYPNPFGSSTTVHFTMPESGHVLLSAYDVLGRRVAVVIDGARSAGTHAESFDAAGLPSGVYLLRLEVNSRSLTRTTTVAR